MKNTIYKTLLLATILGASLTVANGQSLSASTVMAGHKVPASAEEAYAQLEVSINEISGKLRDAFMAHPNLEYRPAHGENGEIIGYLVTGAGSAKEANTIAQLLVSLDELGGLANEINVEASAHADAGRLSKREARN